MPLQHPGGDRRRRLRTILTAAAIAAGGTLAVATPAAAGVSGPCDGQVTIDGTTYTAANDSAGDPVVVPVDAATAAWRGTTGVPITDHTGELGLVVGPGSVRIASWSGENADLETAAEGVYGIAEARGLVPVGLVGLYELTGSHRGSGGSCSGTVMVRVEGAPLATPVGAGAAAVTVLSLAGLAVAGAGGAGAGAPAGGPAGDAATRTTEVP